MKSLRLNRQMRDAIVKNFGEKRLQANPRPVETVTRDSVSAALASYCHDKVYGDMNLEGIPEDMLNFSDYIKVRFPKSEGSDEDKIENIYFEKIDKYNRERKPSTRLSKVEYDLTKSDEGYKKYKRDMKLYKKEQQEIKDYNTDHSRYMQQVRQVVDAVNTTKQLLEVWPEAEQFIPEDIRDPSTITLPSVNIADLNSQVN